MADAKQLKLYEVNLLADALNKAERRSQDNVRRR